MERRTLVDGLVDGIQGGGRRYALVLSQVFVFDSEAAVEAFFASDLSVGIAAAAYAAGGRPATGAAALDGEPRGNE